MMWTIEQVEYGMQIDAMRRRQNEDWVEMEMTWKRENTRLVEKLRQALGEGKFDRKEYAICELRKKLGLQEITNWADQVEEEEGYC